MAYKKKIKPPPPIDDVLMKSSQVVKVLSTTYSDISRLVKRGVLPPPVMINRTRRWKRSDILKIMNGHKFQK